MPLLTLLALAMFALTAFRVAQVVVPMTVAHYVLIARELDPRDALRQPDFAIE